MRNKSFWYLFMAQTVSAFGDFFGLLAIEWLVYEMTGSLLLMGSIFMVMGITQLVIGFLGGPLIDRFNRYQLMVLLDIVSAVAIGIPSVLGLVGLLEIWHLFVAITLLGACSALYKPAGMAVLPNLVEKDQLVRANSMLSMTISSATVVGPGLAGATIQFIGASQCLVVDACSFFLSSCLILMLSRKMKGDMRKVNLASPSSQESGRFFLKKYTHELVDGLRFFGKAPFLLFIMVLISLRNMSAMAVAAITLPYGLEILHLDAFGVGLLSSAVTVGIIAGSWLLVIIGDQENRRFPMIGSVILGGFLYFSLGFIDVFWLALVIFFFLGVTGPLFGSFSSSIYAQVVPDYLRGRVMSARLLVGGSLQPVGSYLGGALSHLYGIPFLFIVVGIVPATAGLIGYFSPLAKKIDGKLEVIEMFSKKGEPVKSSSQEQLSN